MASTAPEGSVTVACATAPGPDLPSAFAAAFCDVLRHELALNRPSTAPQADVSVELARAGAFSIRARVTVRLASGAVRHQDTSLSVRDSTLQPSIAKVLVLPVLKLLE